MLTFSSVIVIFIILMIAMCKKELIKEDFTDEQRSELKQKFGSFLGDPYMREHQGMKSCYETKSGAKVCRRRGALSNNPDATALIGEIISVPWPQAYKLPDQKYKIVSVMTGDPYFSDIFTPGPSDNPDDFYQNLAKTAGLVGIASAGVAIQVAGLYAASVSATSIGLSGVVMFGEANALQLAAYYIGSAGAASLAIAAVAVVAAIYLIYDRFETSISHIQKGSKYCDPVKLPGNHDLMNNKLITEMRMVLHFDSFKTWVNEPSNKVYYINKTNRADIRTVVTPAAAAPAYKPYNMSSYKVKNTDDVVKTTSGTATPVTATATISEKSDLMAIYKWYKKNIIKLANIKKFGSVAAVPKTDKDLYKVGGIFENSRFFLRLRTVGDLVKYIVPDKYKQVSLNENKSEWCKEKRKDINDVVWGGSDDTKCKQPGTNKNKFTRSGEDVYDCLKGITDASYINDDDVRDTSSDAALRSKVFAAVSSEMEAVLAKLSGTVWDKSYGHTREVREDGIDSSRCYYHLYPHIGFDDSDAIEPEESRQYYESVSFGDRPPLEDATNFCPNFRVIDKLDSKIRVDIGPLPKLCEEYPATCVNDLGYALTTEPALAIAKDNINRTAAAKTTFKLGNTKSAIAADFGNKKNGGGPSGIKTKWSDYTTGDIYAQKHEMKEFQYNYDNYVKKDGPGRKVLQKLYKPIYFYVTNFNDYDTKIRAVLRKDIYGLNTKDQTFLKNLTYKFPNKIENNGDDSAANKEKSHLTYATTFPKRPTTQFCAPYIRQVNGWAKSGIFAKGAFDRRDDHVYPEWATDDIIKKCLPGRTGRTDTANEPPTVRSATRPLLTSQLNYMFGIYTYEVDTSQKEIQSNEHFISGNDLTDGYSENLLATSDFDINPENLQIQIDKIRLRKLSKINKEYDQNIACNFTKTKYDTPRPTGTGTSLSCTNPSIFKQCNYNVSRPILIDSKGKKGTTVLHTAINAAIKKGMKFTNNNIEYTITDTSNACIDKSINKTIITLNIKLDVDIDKKIKFNNIQTLSEKEQHDIFYKMKNPSKMDAIGKNRDKAAAELEWAKRMGFLKCYKDTINKLDDDERKKYIPDINEIDPLIQNITEYAMDRDSTAGYCTYLKNKTIFKDKINTNISVANKCKMIEKQVGLNDNINYKYEFKGLNKSIIQNIYKKLIITKKYIAKVTAATPATAATAAPTINGFTVTLKNPDKSLAAIYKKKVLSISDLTNIKALLIYNLTLINISSKKIYKYIITEEEWKKLDTNKQELYEGQSKPTNAKPSALCIQKKPVQPGLQYCPASTSSYSANCPKIYTYYYIKDITTDYEIIDIKVSEIGEKYNKLVKRVQHDEYKKLLTAAGQNKKIKTAADAAALKALKNGRKSTDFSNVNRTKIVNYFESSEIGQQLSSNLKKFATGSVESKLLINKGNTCKDGTLKCNTLKEIANKFVVGNTSANNNTIKGMLISSIPNNIDNKKDYNDWWGYLDKTKFTPANVKKILNYDQDTATGKSYKTLYFKDEKKQLNLDMNYVYDIANSMSFTEGRKLKLAYNKCTDSIADYLP